MSAQRVGWWSPHHTRLRRALALRLRAEGDPAPTLAATLDAVRARLGLSADELAAAVRAAPPDDGVVGRGR